MIPSLFQIGAASVMVTASIALLAWFLKDMAAASGRRMMAMLERAGAAPEVAGRNDAVMREARTRCRRCRSEALCERWLAGAAEGDNDFCPNGQVFRALIRTTGRTAR